MKSITCKNINGHIISNPSKSYMIRILMITLVLRRDIKIINPCLADDCIATLNILKDFGFKIKYNKNSVEILAPNKYADNTHRFNCGESATLFRMLSAILSLLGIKAKLTGGGTLLKRNFRDVSENLELIGIKHKSNSYYLPFETDGKVNKNELIINANQSSQFLSGILIAGIKDNLNITVDGPIISKSYINLTLSVLKKFGINYINLDYTNFIIDAIKTVELKEIFCESDWSGAAYFVVAGALYGNISITGLDLNSKQGDKNIFEIIRQSGGKISTTDDKITVTKSELKSFVYDAGDTPDLVPALIPLALYCNGTSEIKKVTGLINKESNRLQVLISEYSKLGAKIIQDNDSLVIENSKLTGGLVKSHNDHRIAMSFLIASVLSNNPIIIDDINCISKSYPNFVEDFKSVGGEINEYIR